jgi:hypothetical protein
MLSRVAKVGCKETSRCGRTRLIYMLSIRLLHLIYLPSRHGAKRELSFRHVILRIIMRAFNLPAVVRQISRAGIFEPAYAR